MQYTSVFFLGAGGIGMSALERYFKQIGCYVAGYDRTPSALTDTLIKEGIVLHFEDDPEQIPQLCRDPKTTLVVTRPPFRTTIASCNGFAKVASKYTNVHRYSAHSPRPKKDFVWRARTARPQLQP